MGSTSYLLCFYYNGQVLEMMEKDCEDRVAELDADLAQVEAERARAQQLQREAAAQAAAEARNKAEIEETAQLAVVKLVAERVSRDVEVQTLEERERALKKELEATRRKAEADKRTAEAAHAAAVEAASLGSRSVDSSGGGGDPGGGEGGSNVGNPHSQFDDSFASSGYSSTGDSFASDSEDCRTEGDSSASRSRNSSHVSPLIGRDRKDIDGDGDDSDDSDGASSHEGRPRRPPVMVRGQKCVESPFLSDPLHEMTWGRRIALRMQHVSCYRPRGRGAWDAQGVGLQSAWAYFEHSVLPRYVVKDGSPRGSGAGYGRGMDGGQDSEKDGGDSDDDWLDTSKQSKNRQKRGRGDAGGARNSNRGCFQRGDLSKAEPGESKYPTRLYCSLCTSLSQLGDMGIGIGLYFSSLRAVAFITLVAGLISIPNILYFASDDYSKGQPGVRLLLRGSAICTEQTWVPCPTCAVSNFVDRSRIGGAVTSDPNGGLRTLAFARKNTCDGATFFVGIVNMAGLGWVLLAMASLWLYQRRQQIKFDERIQTAQDYSIAIENPPKDATEPEEWKEFFESRFGGHMTCCTVTVDNGLLVKALAERREVLLGIEEKLKEGAAVNALSLSEKSAKIEHRRRCFGRFKSHLSPGIPELAGRLSVLNARIQGLVQQKYRATHVFCT